MSDLYQVTVRRDAVGGPVVKATETPPESWRSHTPVVLLIHGYNNDYDAAHHSYATCLEKLGADQPESEIKIFDRACAFYWPGDASPKWISAASYPVQIGDVVESADRLVRFLRDLYAGGREQSPLFILAHSLGCRVALEVVNSLKAEPWFGQVLTGVCLMAAAVDVLAVTPNGGGLYDAAKFCATDGRRLTIVSSSDDSVLHLFFPLGSTLSEAGSGRALGRFGPPPGLLEIASSVPLTRLDHGDYWPIKTPELQYVLAKALGLQQTRNVIEPNTSPAHELEPASVIESRSTPVWEAP